MPNTSTTIISNAISTLKDIRVSNINRLILGHLNINSLRNKFNFLCEQIKGYINIFMLSELKLDDSFPLGQFLIDGFHAPFRFDRDKNGGGIIPAGNYMFKVNNRNTRTWCEICSKLTIKTPERR